MARRWSYAAAVLLPLVAILALGMLQTDRLGDFRNLVFDAYQRLAPRQWNPQAPVRILDIDDDSLRRIGQWPWPRTRMAELVQKLTAMGAAAIAFDMVFSEPDRTSAENVLSLLPASPARDLIERELAGHPVNDEALATAISGAPVVLGTILTQGSGSYSGRHGIASAGDDPVPFLPTFSGAVVPLPILMEKAAGLGALNWLPDSDQTVRRVPLLLSLNGTIVPGLAAEALRVAQGASTFVIRASNASGHTTFGAKTGINAVKIGGIEVPTDPHGDIRIRFSHTEPARFVPAWKVLEGQLPADEIAGRIVLIGTSAAGLLDQRSTPVDSTVAGVEVHAQLLEHILEGYALTRPDWALGVELFLAAFAGLAIAFLLPRIEAAGTALLGIGAISALGFASWHAFSQRGILIDPLYPSAAVIAVYLSGVIYLYRAEQKQKQWVRDAFSRFVSPAVVEQLTRNPDRLTLGGELRDLTIMFCDIRGFTTISEGLNPQSLTIFMNTYLSALTDVVLAHDATLDKYIGDAIMAFWNAPLEDPEHAAKALRASLGMVAALERLNTEWRADAKVTGREHREVRFGIGLATGPCSVGNFGSTRRFDYSAFGDDVNLSSRLEGASKVYGVTILASEPTRESAPDFAWLEVDAVKVKGKTRATRIFTLAGDPAHAVTPHFQALSECHESMLASFRGRRFDEAAGHADRARGLAGTGLERLYDFYIDQSRAYASTPPPEDWDGVTEFAHK